jgi:hypothetical protein
MKGAQNYEIKGKKPDFSSYRIQAKLNGDNLNNDVKPASILGIKRKNI